MQLQTPIHVASQQLQSADGGATYPVGDYPAVLVSSSIKAVKDKPHAGYVEYVGNFIDGPFKGATFQWRFNVYSDSPQAAEIAVKQLASLGAVVGVPVINDTNDVLNRPFIVCYRPRRDDANKTEIAGCKDVHGNDPAQAGRGPQAPQPGGPQGGFAAPALYP